MIIERIQVEEGFLDGLDLRFSAGLNVLIGPRGSGKTSVIELIRFCLGARTLTEKAGEATLSHAYSILGSGKVTVTFNERGTALTVSRSSEHWTKPSVEFVPPLVLAQNEIETIGLHSMGRLRLLDRVGAIDAAPANETSALARVRSRSEERRSLMAELQEIRQQIRKIREELQTAEELKKQHTEALGNLEKARTETERLSLLGGWLAQVSVRTGLYARTDKSLSSWIERLNNDRNMVPVVEPWPPSAGGDDPMAAVRAAMAKSLGYFDHAVQQANEAHQKLRDLAGHNQNQTLMFDEEARTLRRKLESLQQGAGEIARRLGQLKEKEGQLSALVSLEESRQKTLAMVQGDRKLSLDSVELIREERFAHRRDLAARLNDELSPRIRIAVERAGQTDEYASAIIAALRGSGLKFNEVGPLIAENISPREFIELVENEHADTIADITGISFSRSANIVGRLNTYGVEAILTSPVEDGVTISLLDGSNYKTTEELSTGQRCTAILPLLLHQNPLSLLVDQPEDHLDNAFIVETLIKMITLRKHEGQMIFSTHNPNIPVLGEADKVILLGSDGRRGFVLHSGPLDELKTVNAITSVMEGGLDAFDRRSAFYHSAPAR